MAGTVVLTDHYELGNVRTVVLTATADASDGSFPATTLASLGLGEVAGTLLAVQTNPSGVTAPDDNYDVTLIDGDGLDRFGGACLNRDTATAERAILAEAPFVAVGESLTLTITGNTNPDAVVVITIYYTTQVVAAGWSFTDGALDVYDADALLELQTLSGAVHMEDDAHASTDAGVSILAVANEALADLVDTDGDYTPVATDKKGRLLVSGVTDVEVVGNVAHDAADSGNPVKIGGKANNTFPTAVAAGDRADLWTGLMGQAIIGGVTGAAGSANAGVALVPRASDTASGVPLGVVGYAYDGSSTHVPMRGNTEATALASAARTATTNSSDITNYNGRGCRVFVNVTAITDTPSVVFTIEVKDPISGTYTAILTSAAIVGTGHTVLEVYPGIDAVANLAVNKVLSRTWRVTATHGDADSITYSVGYAHIL